MKLKEPRIVLRSDVSGIEELFEVQPGELEILLDADRREEWLRYSAYQDFIIWWEL